ncbi:hypothetical protein GCM10020358_82910 [Amorphoplanes nipponensis]
MSARIVSRRGRVPALMLLTPAPRGDAPEGRPPRRTDSSACSFETRRRPPAQNEMVIRYVLDDRSGPARTADVVTRMDGRPPGRRCGHRAGSSRRACTYYPVRQRPSACSTYGPSSTASHCARRHRNLATVLFLVALLAMACSSSPTARAARRAQG